MKYNENLEWNRDEHIVFQKWLDFAKNFNIPEESIFEEIKKLKLDIRDINNWLEVTLKRINEAIFREALRIFNEGNFYPDKQSNRKFREYFQIALQDNVYDWYPKINRTDVHFNNILDEVIGISEIGNNGRGIIIQKVLDYLFNKFETQYGLK
jgi:hypothetical protein